MYNILSSSAIDIKNSFWRLRRAADKIGIVMATDADDLPLRSHLTLALDPVVSSKSMYLSLQ